MGKSTWTEDRIAILKQLWGAGKTAAEIAEQLGGGVTRNAVIGKAHRLGLSGRASPIHSKTVSQAKAADSGRQTAPAAPKRQKMTDETSQILPEGKGVSLMDLDAKTCRWPCGDPKKAGFKFCGANSLPGLPYCAEHAAIAYQGSTRRFAISEKELNSGAGSDALDELDNALQI